MKKKYRILLAEDDKYISAAFFRGLTQAGFEVITAYDGEEALSKIKTSQPDLVMLDILMPKKDGFEVLEELSREETAGVISGEVRKSIPIIAFTNMDQDEDIRRARDLGVVEYLVKANFSMSEVIKKIQGHLGISDKGGK